MNPDPCEARIIAVAIRSQRLGLAVFEGSQGLLDWRTVHYERNRITHVRKAMQKIASLIAFFAPAMIVIEHSRLLHAARISNIRSISKFIKREAALRLIPVRLMNRKEVRETFRDFHAGSKDAIAAVLAQSFSELRPWLPPKRKIWHGEQPIMPMFDAVALAVAYWDQQNTQQPEVS